MPASLLEVTMFTSMVTIKARLISTLLFLSAVTVAIAATGLYATMSVKHGMDDLYGDELEPAILMAEIRVLVRSNAIALDDALLDPTPARIEATQSIFSANKEKIDADWKKLNETSLTPDEHQTMEVFWAKRIAFVDLLKESFALLQAAKVDEARKLRVTKLEAINAEVAAAVNKVLEAQQASAHDTLQAGQSAYQSSRAWIIGVLLASLAIAAVAGNLLVRSFSRSINQAMEVSENIAAGKLGHDIEIQREDECGQLLRSLQTMDVMLSDIISSVHSSSDSIGTATRQLSQGNDDLSQRTQEQASALEETASSMEQMTATVKQNADSARQANQLSARAREQAVRGVEVVSRTVVAMNEINDSSRRIADIIGVIDEIAFQTNLLALNAAVEAARAGEQGRGFAVVASEVRNLAQRSASAAKEIKDLINTSVDKVKVGSDLVSESGKMLDEIVNSVKQVTDVVAEIAAASQEQASGIDQVNHAITQMDSVTQQNAALVEEAASAGKALEHQAVELVEKVSFFKLSNSNTDTMSSSVAMNTAAPAMSRNATSFRKSVRSNAELVRKAG